MHASLLTQSIAEQVAQQALSSGFEEAIIEILCRLELGIAYVDYACSHDGCEEVEAKAAKRCEL